jgi:hypothetical protein
LAQTQVPFDYCIVTFDALAGNQYFLSPFDVKSTRFRNIAWIPDADCDLISPFVSASAVIDRAAGIIGICFDGSSCKRGATDVDGKSAAITRALKNDEWTVQESSDYPVVSRAALANQPTNVAAR